MADIFVSYTSSDRDWAHWIGNELRALGHTPRIHEWEIRGGESFYDWMKTRLDAADHALCVISPAYLQARHSQEEFHAAMNEAAAKGTNFLLPVLVEDCQLPVLIAHRNKCDLFDTDQTQRSERFRAFMARSAVPNPSIRPVHCGTVSNIPISVPQHFMGRTEELDEIHRKLGEREGRVAITALHGLRGVGKTVLAAVYAEQHRDDYRATWWIRAEIEAGMRADLVGLGVRLDWVPADAKEEPALAAVLDRLRQEGDGILLIYDNAVSADAIRPYLPRGGPARVLVTSNSHAWRGLAEPVEIEVWPKEVGADYLIARTGRAGERAAAEALSEALGGLPLAHEQAGAYCERLEISLMEYRRRFEAAPSRMLDAEKDAPAEYHDRLTVSKTFALAIDEAAKLHPAAESLLVHAALLAPQPIPLFLFREGRQKFGEPFASALADDGLDEAIGALRAFALVDREEIPDERDPTITTDTVRLHRLVRQVAVLRCESQERDTVLRRLIEATADEFPERIFDVPAAWPRARRLDALAVALVGDEIPHSEDAEIAAAYLLNGLASYRQYVLSTYGEAQRLFERSLAIFEKAVGTNDPRTSGFLINLAGLFRAQGNVTAAQPLYERALAINERALGPDHPQTAIALHCVAGLLKAQGNEAASRPLYERALRIIENALGPDHRLTATILNDLSNLLVELGDIPAARPLIKRALGIFEKAFGADHHLTGPSLSNLARLLYWEGNLPEARHFAERALSIWENALGAEHPWTAASLFNFSIILCAEGKFAEARPLLERALAIREKVLGPEHPDTVTTRKKLAALDA